MDFKRDESMYLILPGKTSQQVAFMLMNPKQQVLLLCRYRAYRFSCWQVCKRNTVGYLYSITNPKLSLNASAVLMDGNRCLLVFTPGAGRGRPDVSGSLL